MVSWPCRGGSSSPVDTRSGQNNGPGQDVFLRAVFSNWDPDFGHFLCVETAKFLF